LWAGNKNSTITAYLNVNFTVTGGSVAPPALTLEPASQTVAEGGTATFSAAASGAGLAFQWLFNSNNMAGATGSSLVLTNVSSTQGGYYAVTVTNAGGRVTSTNALLTVLPGVPPPPVITSDPTNQIVAAGETINLGVGATGSGLVYQWYLNSNILAGATGPALVISNAAVVQSGFYFAGVSNSGGTSVSAAARVLVVPPPGPSLVGSIETARLPGGQFSISFSTGPGYRYTLESSEDLKTVNWTALTNVPAAFDSRGVSVNISVAGVPREFFRVTAVAGP
jgi:hypothetical protein